MCGGAVAGRPVDPVVVEDVRLFTVGGDLGGARGTPDLGEVAWLQRSVCGGVQRVAVGVDVHLGASRNRAATVEIGGGVGGHVEGDLVLPRGVLRARCREGE